MRKALRWPNGWRAPQALLEHRIQSGAIAQARKQYSKAEKIYKDALAGSVRAEDPIDTFECHAALSTLYRETGSPAKAGAEYHAASAVIDPICTPGSSRMNPSSPFFRA
jgi:tetratricopeptide (TPR) repeat protein